VKIEKGEGKKGTTTYLTSQPQTWQLHGGDRQQWQWDLMFV
jgi:hypothetical protein